MHESDEGANTLIQNLFENDICALLFQNLERLDESVREESDGVHKTLCKSLNFEFFGLFDFTYLFIYSNFWKSYRICTGESSWHRKAGTSPMDTETIKSKNTFRCQ